MGRNGIEAIGVRLEYAVSSCSFDEADTMVSFGGNSEAQHELIEAIHLLSEFNLPEELRGLRRLIPPAGAQISEITVTFVEGGQQTLFSAPGAEIQKKSQVVFSPIVIQGPPLSSTVLNERR